MIRLPWQTWILLAAVAGIAFVIGIFFAYDWLR